MHKPSAKKVFIVGIAVLIALNLYTFIVAYPETSRPTQASTLQALYWQKISQLITWALGGYGIIQRTFTLSELYMMGNQSFFLILKTYKYLPSFLLIVSPFLSLNYQQALLAFDIVQFMLLPLMAYLLYKILANKPLAVTFVVMVVALLLPFPSPQGGFSLKLLLAVGRGTSQSLHHLSASTQLLFRQPRKTIPVWNCLCIWVF